MEYSLQMVFLCESGENSSITISEVKPGLTNSDVIALNGHHYHKQYLCNK